MKRARNLSDPPPQKRCPECLQRENSVSRGQNHRQAPPQPPKPQPGAPAQRTDDGHHVRQHVALRHPVQAGLGEIKPPLALCWDKDSLVTLPEPPGRPRPQSCLLCVSAAGRNAPWGRRRSGAAFLEPPVVL